MAFCLSNVIALIVKQLFYFFLFVIVLCSCSSDSQEILSHGKMEDIIYDLHLAQGMADKGDYDKRAMKEAEYRAAVLKKYEITQAEWDSSFTYYCRHADELHEIYNNVAERMRDEIVSLGGEVALNGEGFSADTANIWNMERNFILVPNEPYNVKSYVIPADSTIKKGDRLTMQFSTQFVYQDGMRDVVAVMAVTFQNDSVASETRHATQQGTTSFSIQDDQHLGIKKVSGYFIVGSNLNDVPSSTVRLASISNVRIVIAHEEKKAEEKESDKEANDSLKNARRDSIEATRLEHQSTPPLQSEQPVGPPPAKIE